VSPTLQFKIDGSKLKPLVVIVFEIDKIGSISDFEHDEMIDITNKRANIFFIL
jgi:hypothetical protein